MSDSVPRVKVPPVEKASPEEIERRRKVVAAILELRRQIGPIGIRTNDLFEDDSEGEPLND